MKEISIGSLVASEIFTENNNASSDVYIVKEVSRDINGKRFYCIVNDEGEKINRYFPTVLLDMRIINELVSI